MDYRQPHSVLLFFEKGGKWDQSGLTAQWDYYKSMTDKLLHYGRPAHGAVVFVSLTVSCDDELLAILENDPALQADVLEVIQATPVL